MFPESWYSGDTRVLYATGKAMRWFARLMAIVALGTLVGCYSSGAVVPREPPSWCRNWQPSPEGGYCADAEDERDRETQQAFEAQDDYHEYLEERNDYMNDPANHGYADESPSDNRWDCDDFTSQAAAQARFEADRSDPNNLDGDHDRRACE